MRFPGFIGPSYTSQSVNVDCQRCVNMFPEINDLGTGKDREVASLVSTPGLTLKVTLANSPVRGLHRASNGTLFAVGGNKLYSISSSWVATELGTLQTSTGAVSIADNGLVVVVVDGTYGYAWTIGSSTFAQIADGDFYASDLVTFQDGYFIFTKKNSQQFFISGLNETSTPTFDGLDISSAEGSPDYLVGCISANQNLYLFGAQSTEVFYNSGDADFPFIRNQGAVIGVGCLAPHSIQDLQGSVFWLGADKAGTGIIYRMQGYQAQRISTPAIEAVVRGLDQSTIDDARAWTYQQGGHVFYCINFPGDDTTWCYDATTQLWHERQYLDLWGLERHRADCHALAYSTNVVGDYETGDVYALDPDVYTDNGTYVTRMRRAPHFSQDGIFIRHNSFQLDMETGVGLSTGQGSAPTAVLRWSDDGGHTWSNERETSIGAIGNYGTRAIWRRLGSSRDRVYEVKITDPVKVVMIGASLGVEQGVA